MKDSVVVGKFNMIGVNTIDIEKVVKRWSHLWFISQYGATFQLIKAVRKDSELTELKTKISAEQANELIDRLALESIKSSLFKKGLTWRKY